MRAVPPVYATMSLPFPAAEISVAELFAVENVARLEGGAEDNTVRLPSTTKLSLDSRDRTWPSTVSGKEPGVIVVPSTTNTIDCVDLSLTTTHNT